MSERKVILCGPEDWAVQDAETGDAVDITTFEIMHVRAVIQCRIAGGAWESHFLPEPPGTTRISGLISGREYEFRLAIEGPSGRGMLLCSYTKLITPTARADSDWLIENSDDAEVIELDASKLYSGPSAEVGQLYSVAELTNETAIDLFGEIPAQNVEPQMKPKNTQPKGYAGIPGTGPVGKFCRNCEHYEIRRTPAGYTHPKCGLMRHAWTNGRGSDIKVSSPACSRFVPDEIIVRSI